jgi:hypothetical protein
MVKMGAGLVVLGDEEVGGCTAALNGWEANRLDELDAGSRDCTALSRAWTNARPQ